MIHFDLHCDTMTKIYNKKAYLNKNNLCIDLEKLKKFNKAIQVFANFSNDVHSAAYAFKKFLAVDEYFERELKKNLVTVQLINNCRQLETEKTGIIKSIENIRIIDNDIKKLELLFKMGYKMTTLTWNDSNQFAGGKNNLNDGVSRLGELLINLCEDTGVIIDVSHLNDKSFFDVERLAKKTFIASHSNARAVTGNSRNLTDDQIKVIIERNGLIGINYHTKFLSDIKCEFEDVYKHINHILELGGSKVLALGSDFDGADLPPFLKDISCIKNFKDQLKLYGLNEKTICDIMYNNAYNFFANNIKGA